MIVAELREVLKTYGDERRTQIVDRVEEIKLEDLIKDEEMAITVSHAGYIKRTSVDVYRHQSRGGKGRIGAKTRDDDFVEHFLCGLGAQLHFAVHVEGPHLLAEGLRNSRSGGGHAREGDQQPGPLPGR